MTTEKHYLVTESWMADLMKYLVLRPYVEVTALLDAVRSLQPIENSIPLTNNSSVAKTPVILDNTFRVNNLSDVDNPEVLQGTNPIKDKIAKN